MAISEVSEELRKRIDSIPFSPRLQGLRDKYFAETSQACSERLTSAMLSLQETEGENIEIRRAKMVRRILEDLPLDIYEGELTAGCPSRAFRGSYPYLDWDSTYLDEVMRELKLTFGGPAMWGSISKEDFQACTEVTSYFRGKTPAELSRETLKTLWGDWYKDAVEAGVVINPYDEYAYLPGVPKWEKLMEKGLQGIVEEAKERIQHFRESGEDDVEKLYFWQAVIIVGEAVISFARRYAQFAKELALKEQDAVRRKELEEIAEMCQWVPMNPPRTFHEAIQSLRLTHVALMLENGRKAADLGRMDQYLYPYFKRDIAEGRLTLEKAVDLLGDFISYVARLEQVVTKRFQELNQATMINHVTLGGVTRDGEDATNELTHLILHTAGLVRYAEPHFSIRLCPSTPHWLVLKGLEVNTQANGIPAYFNNDHVIDYQVKRGVPIEEARDWVFVGCSQPVATPQRHYKPQHFNASCALDLALHNGVSPKTGKQVGIITGDPRDFKSFEEVYEAYKKQYEFIVRRMLVAARVIDRITAQS